MRRPKSTVRSPWSIVSSSGGSPTIRERRSAALTRLRNSRIEKGLVM